MKINDVIFQRKRKEIKVRILFIIFSFIFHMVIGYYFILSTLPEEPKEIVYKKIISVIPVKDPRLIFPDPDKSDKPEAPKLSAQNNAITLKAQQNPARKESDTKKEPATKPIEPTQPEIARAKKNRKADISTVNTATQRQIVLADILRNKQDSQSDSFKVPFDGRKVLEPETLKEIIRQMEKNKAKEIPVAKLDPFGTPLSTDPKKHRPMEDDIVVDLEGKRYFSRRGWDITPWAKRIAARINRNWSILSLLRVNGKAEVGVAVTINKEGKLLDSEITRSCNNQPLDQAALNAVKLTRPFPALPDSYPGKSMKAYFLFNYIFPKSRYNRDQGLRFKDLNDIVLSMGFLKGPLFNTSYLPPHLVLALESSSEAYYRLMKEDEAVAVGKLKQGFNYMDIPTNGLFKQSGKHSYQLEMKLKDRVMKKTILLDISCRHSDNSGQVREEIKDLGYGLAVFVENQLLAYHKKTAKYRQVSFLQKVKEHVALDRAHPAPPSPFDIAGDKANKSASIPVLLIPYLLYSKVIKPAVTKKKLPRPYIHERLTGSFLVKGPDGTKHPLDIDVMLQVASNEG